MSRKIALVKKLIENCVTKIHETSPENWNEKTFQSLVGVYKHGAVHHSSELDEKDADFILQRRNCVLAHLIVFLVNENMDMERYQQVLLLMRQRYLIIRDLAKKQLPLTAPGGVKCVFCDSCSVDVLGKFIMDRMVWRNSYVGKLEDDEDAVNQAFLNHVLMIDDETLATAEIDSEQVDSKTIEEQWKSGVEISQAILDCYFGYKLKSGRTMKNKKMKLKAKLLKKQQNQCAVVENLVED